jgi:hypothetical protein
VKTKILTRDPDMVGSLAALRRAARVARKRAIEAGTPFIVMRKGKIVDGNAPKSSRSRGGRKKKSA